MPASKHPNVTVPSVLWPSLTHGDEFAPEGLVVSTCLLPWLGLTISVPGQNPYMLQGAYSQTIFLVVL